MKGPGKLTVIERPVGAGQEIICPLQSLNAQWARVGAWVTSRRTQRVCVSSTISERLERVHASPELDKDQGRNLALMRKKQDGQEGPNS